MTADHSPLILVADDDADLREMLAMVLEMHDLRVVLARDGIEALARARSTPGLALVLLDLMMPGMNGADVLEEIRRDPRLASLPVIVISGDVRGSEIASSLGADGYLGKPLGVNDLMREVDRFITVRKPGPAHAPAPAS